MSKNIGLKRYIISAVYTGIGAARKDVVQYPIGDWVKYEDCQSLCEQLKAANKEIHCLKCTARKHRPLNDCLCHLAELAAIKEVSNGKRRHQ